MAHMAQREQLAQLYKVRFNEDQQTPRDELWRTLCGRFFARYVRPSDVVVDVGAGHCEFINNICCEAKYAVDINPDVRHFAGPQVRCLVQPAHQLYPIADGTVDVVFASNFFGHLESKDLLLSTLLEIGRVLRESGRLLILQPNIRYLGAAYWDFFDHHLPLSDKAMMEALAIADFGIERVLQRFLPYTTKSRLPINSAIVSLYLRLPLVYVLFGKQMFIVAKKNKGSVVRLPETGAAMAL